MKKILHFTTGLDSGGAEKILIELVTNDSLNEGYDFLETLRSPYVLKADGLAAGKGVLIIDDLEEAKRELKAMLTDAKFGDASSKVVIE